jgi:hypothetical protein
MKIDLHTKLLAMLWDMPEKRRSELADRIIADPVNVFLQDEQLFVKALNSLKWYELTMLVPIQELISLLADPTIRKLFPPQRRTYYTNARRLLSKYCLPASG